MPRFESSLGSHHFEAIKALMSIMMLGLFLFLLLIWQHPGLLTNNEFESRLDSGEELTGGTTKDGNLRLAISI
jgi:hypothetical protein